MSTTQRKSNTKLKILQLQASANSALSYDKNIEIAAKRTLEDAREYGFVVGVGVTDFMAKDEIE